MSFQLVNSNAVVAARQFNPSVLSQLWLVDNQIVAREEFADGGVFTEMIVQVNAAPFAILVTPDQLQFVPRVDPVAQQAIITERLGALIRALPHTPYTAVGLNFTWHKSSEERAEFGRISRRLFYREGSSLFREFQADDARFGGYLSKDCLGLRMKLDIKPMTTHTENIANELMQFAFNFHLDVFNREDRAESIVVALANWDAAREEATRIMDRIQEDLA